MTDMCAPRTCSADYRARLVPLSFLSSQTRTINACVILVEVVIRAQHRQKRMGTRFLTTRVCIRLMHVRLTCAVLLTRTFPSLEGFRACPAILLVQPRDFKCFRSQFRTDRFAKTYVTHSMPNFRVTHKVNLMWSTKHSCCPSAHLPLVRPTPWSLGAGSALCPEPFSCSGAIG